MLLDVCALYILNGDALWQSIYRMQIGHTISIYDQTLMYNTYTMAEACAYIHAFILITTLNNSINDMTFCVKCDDVLW